VKENMVETTAMVLEKETYANRIESIIGTIFCSVICIYVIFIAVGRIVGGTSSSSLLDLSFWEHILPYPLAAADGWVLWHAWKHMRHKNHPVPVNVALSVSAIPRPLCITFGLLWACHLWICIQAGLTPLDLTCNSLEDGLASILTQLAWSIGTVYVFNIFFLLSVFAFTNKESLVVWLWKRRWWFDISIGGVCAIINTVSHFGNG
jgi:hypothetical protein